MLEDIPVKCMEIDNYRRFRANSLDEKQKNPINGCKVIICGHLSAIKWIIDRDMALFALKGICILLQQLRISKREL